MSVTVAQLNQNNVALQAYITAMKDQLDIIDTKIRCGEQKFGKNYIIHELPTSFVHRNTNKCTAQKIIYAGIIKSLNNRGFDTKIVIEESTILLYVGWEVKLDNTEVSSINKIIKESRISLEEYKNIIDAANKNSV